MTTSDQPGPPMPGSPHTPVRVRTGSGCGWVVWALIVVGVVVGAVSVLLVVTGAFDADEVAVFDLDEGDCVDHDFSDETAEIRSITVVGCGDAHTGIVFATGRLDPDADRAYPTDPELFAEIDRRCAAAFDRRPELAGQYVPNYPIAPDERSWESLGGPFVCIALRLDAIAEV